MENPPFFSPLKPHFVVPLLLGFRQHLTIPVAFYEKHIEGKNEKKTAKLRSEVSYRTWEVKREGRRFTDGWEDFAADHDFRIGDIMVFRHEGNMVFHVTGFGSSFCNLQYALYPSDDEEDDMGSSSCSRKKRAKKNPKKVAESSSDQSRFVASVTASNLLLDTLNLPTGFARSNCLEGRWGEIVLTDEQARSWKLDLRHREPGGQVYIMSGWTRFCQSNCLKDGSSVTLNLVRNGATPMLQMSQAQSSNNSGTDQECSEAYGNALLSERGSDNERSSGECSKIKEPKTRSRQKCSTSARQNRLVTLTLRPLQRYKLPLPKAFTRANGIEKPGKITLMDKHGEELQVNLWKEKRRGTMMLGKGIRSFCKRNGLRVGESFLLELIWRETTTPVLKFCSKTRNKERDSDNGVESREHETAATAADNGTDSKTFLV